MNSPTFDAKDLLVAAGVGKWGTSGPADAWPIYIGQEPDGAKIANDIITLYDTPGGSPNPKWLLDQPRFLVRVRAVKYDDGYQKAEQVKSTLLGLPSQDINGIRYVGIWCVQDTFFLQADSKGRYVFVNTWRVIREPNEGAHRRPL